MYRHCKEVGDLRQQQCRRLRRALLVALVYARSDYEFVGQLINRKAELDAPRQKPAPYALPYWAAVSIGLAALSNDVLDHEDMPLVPNAIHRTAALLLAAVRPTSCLQMQFQGAFPGLAASASPPLKPNILRVLGWAREI